MASSGTFKELKDGVSMALVHTTRTTGQISNEDLSFQRVSNPSIIPQLDQQSSRLLNLAESLTKIAALDTDIAAPQISDPDSVEENWRGIVDVIDNLLERTDACLDEYTGIIKKLSPSQEDSTHNPAIEMGKPRQWPPKAYRPTNITKPQLFFEQTPRNNQETSFKPLLRSKPHAIIPLEESLKITSSEDGFNQYDAQFYLSLQDAPPNLKDLINSHLRFKHPYETEIRAAQYPAAVHTKTDPIPSLPYDSTEATFVDTPEAVAVMLGDLKQAKEIAVDLEHHDEHSYMGIVSLMQISTRDKDWVVDTLKPWREDLQVLNEVFTDPNILKVFHGSTSDILWLQRDLGLYVVGLFDTYHASYALRFSKHSLAYLLEYYVKISADKRYQMADWRIRPLPTEMFDYARSDTHFLLYIYDRMRNQLIDDSDISQPDGNLIEHVMNKSKSDALQRYERPFYDAQRGSGQGGWFNMLTRSSFLPNGEQRAVFKAVHRWRDNVARQEDESVQWILPKHVLFSIARQMPTTASSLVKCSHPMSKPFCALIEDLLEAIKRAKAAAANGGEIEDTMQTARPVRTEGAANGVDTNRPSVPHESKAASVPDQEPRSRLPARSNESNLWGPTLLDGAFDQGARIQPTSESFHLALPLPQLTAEVFADLKINENFGTAGKPDPGARAEHHYTKERRAQEDSVFVVKESGGPRKRKPTDLETAPEPVLSHPKSYSEDEEDGEEVKSLSLAERPDQAEMSRRAKQRQKRQEKKLEKQRRKQDQALAESAGNGPGSGTAKAFDYANAPSVLHARKDGARRPDASKSANPYAKSMDAPKSMRKNKQEVAGKSMTYKASALN